MYSESGKDTIEVRISRRVLWIGNDAYPLQNIARVGPREVELPRQTPVKNFLKAVVAATIVSVVLGFVLNAAIGWLIFLVIGGASTYVLVRALSREEKKLFTLTIETAGASNSVLLSSDIAALQDIARSIMKAIDDPQFEFSRSITVDARGANIGQIGDHGQHSNTFH